MIYRMHPLTNTYLCLHIEGKAARKALGEDTDFNIDPSPVSYLAGWKPMRVDFYSDSAQAATMPDIAMRVGKLYLSEKAYHALCDTLVRWGEFLPVFHSEGEGYIFNCLTLAEQYNALDSKLSMHDPIHNNFSIVFNEKKLEKVNIFRTELELEGFFCTDLVRKIIIEHELKGIEFSKDTGHPFPPDTNMKHTH